MRIDVVTIFPAYLAPLDLSLVGKARAARPAATCASTTCATGRPTGTAPWTTPRSAAAPGMVMRPDVWGAALDDVLDAAGRAPARARRRRGSGSPSGTAEALAGEQHLAIACGRYEGIDARVMEHYRGRGTSGCSEVSLGDYVLNGGEVAALVVVEAVARLLPGVVGNPHSLVEESHGAAGLLEYPVYTKPPTGRASRCPRCSTSGHHARIERWRRDEALRRTAARAAGPGRRARPGRPGPARRRRAGGARLGASRPDGVATGARRADRSADRADEARRTHPRVGAPGRRCGRLVGRCAPVRVPATGETGARPRVARHRHTATDHHPGARTGAHDIRA